MARPIVPAAALALILSGCLAPAAPTVENAPRADDPLSALLEAPEAAAGLPAPARFSAPVIVDAARWSGEPSIVADANGIIYVTGAGGMTRYARYPEDAPADAGQSYIWVSEDGGATFRFVGLNDLVRFRNAGFGVEGDLAVGEDGKTVYFVDMVGLFQIATARSTDGGKTWLEGNPAASPVPLVDRPWIAAGKGQDVYVSFLQLAQGVWVLKSTDGGLTFPQAAPVSATTSYGGGRLAVDRATGAVYVPVTEGSGAPALAVSRDGGNTFEIKVLDSPHNGAFGNLPWLALDARGALHYAWAQQATGGHFDVLYAASPDGGETWAPTLVLNAANTTAVMPSVEAGADGRVLVAWYQTETPVDSNAAAPEATWRVAYAQSRDGLAPSRAFQRGYATPVMHEGVICTTGLGCAASAGGSTEGRKLLDFLDVDALPDGTPIIAYTDTVENEAREPRVAFVKLIEGEKLR